MRKLISAAIALASCTPAYADWQTTKWGMTEEEATAAFPGSTYTTGGVTYDVKMEYKDGGLVSVTLLPQDRTQCGPLKLALDLRYGRGELMPVSGLMWAYTDFKGRNIVFFNTDGRSDPRAFCGIMYTSLDHPQKTDVSGL